MEFIFSAANLRAEVFGIKQNRDMKAVTKIVMGVRVPEFVPKSGVRIDTTDAEAQARANDSSYGK